jgi:hypothetical protein
MSSATGVEGAEELAGPRAGDGSPGAGLMRRFVIDWLSRADPAACAELMAPDYTLHIGGHVLAGRADYQATVQAQLFDRFPGVLNTVHDLIASGDRVALRFTLHGASADGGRAAWRGLGLFWHSGGRLVRNVTEEDYLGRRRQLATGDCDPVDPPMVAPWAQQCVEADPSAEAAVREWLGSGEPGPGSGQVVLDDARPGHDAPAVLTVESTGVDELFSAGRQVAFRAVQRGTYRGGLDGLADQVGAEAELGLIGLVRVDDAGAISGHVVRDRLGLRRRLQR